MEPQKSLIRQYNKLQRKYGDSRNYANEYANKKIFKNTYSDASKSMQTMSNVYNKQSKVISAELRKMKISTLKTNVKRTTVTEFAAGPYFTYAKFRSTPISKLKINKKAYKAERARYKAREAAKR